MLFLANENFPRLSVIRLRDAGYDVAYGSEDAPGKEIIFEILLTNPVSDFLQLTAYTVSLVETIPIVSIQPIPVQI